MARLTTTWLTLAAAGGASVTGVGALDLARDGGLRAGSFAETTIGSPLDDPSVEGRFAVSAGYELVITCWGEGAPTIVLEPGHPDPGHDQFGGTPFLEELASMKRVCVYDRAGEGASDAPPIERRDADDVVRDLHDVLAAADVEGPHLLVGASFGGMIVTQYAETFPDDVVGVVLLDVPAPSADLDGPEFPELQWDHPTNAERLDIGAGFEGRFARQPPRFEAPLLFVTALDGETDVADQSVWLDCSPDAEQIELAGGHDVFLSSPVEVVDAIITFVDR